MRSLRVGCWSDLHLDQEYNYLRRLKRPDVDVLLIPGDLACDHNLVHKALIQCSEWFNHVVWVPGNHEFEDKDIHQGRKALAAFDVPDNCHMLDDGFVDIDGIRFIGSTLWSDCGDPFSQEQIQQFVFPAWAIKNDGRGFSPSDSTRLHQQMLGYIQYQLAESRRNDLTSVVITHHAPSIHSVHARFLASKVNGAFYTDLTDFIEVHQPGFWFHGHMHNSCRYEISGCQVLCNPSGGSHYENHQFNPELVVEIPKRRPYIF